MKVLIVYAHPSHKSFCHAVLEQFRRGLEAAGLAYEVVDLYAMKFDPVLKERDYPNWISDSMPTEALKSMILENSGGPVQRFFMERWLRNQDAASIARQVRKLRPRDVVLQQEKLAAAQGVVIISPIWFVGFPAILKGWMERVFSPGFAYNLAPEGWLGDVHGRIGLLKQQKALILSTTLFDEKSYDEGLREAMCQLIDDFGFRYPGIQQVEHVYFYSVSAVSAEIRQSYLQRAYQLGRAFCNP